MHIFTIKNQFKLFMLIAFLGFIGFQHSVSMADVFRINVPRNPILPAKFAAKMNTLDNSLMQRRTVNSIMNITSTLRRACDLSVDDFDFENQSTTRVLIGTGDIVSISNFNVLCNNDTPLNFATTEQVTAGRGLTNTNGQADPLLIQMVLGPFTADLDRGSLNQISLNQTHNEMSTDYLPLTEKRLQDFYQKLSPEDINLLAKLSSLGANSNTAITYNRNDGNIQTFPLYGKIKQGTIEKSMRPESNTVIVNF